MHYIHYIRSFLKRNTFQIIWIINTWIHEYVEFVQQVHFIMEIQKSIESIHSKIAWSSFYSQQIPLQQIMGMESNNGSSKTLIAFCLILSRNQIRLNPYYMYYWKNYLSSKTEYIEKQKTSSTSQLRIDQGFCMDWFFSASLIDSIRWDVSLFVYDLNIFPVSNFMCTS